MSHIGIWHVNSLALRRPGLIFRPLCRDAVVPWTAGASFLVNSGVEGRSVAVAVLLACWLAVRQVECAGLLKEAHVMRTSILIDDPLIDELRWT